MEGVELGQCEDAVMDSFDMSESQLLTLNAVQTWLGPPVSRLSPGIIRSGAGEAVSTLIHRDLSQKAKMSCRV